jgi:hypothetical protein
MRLISDPDHWYERSSAETTVNPDDDEAILLDGLSDNRRRQIRDQIDRGEEPDQPLLTRKESWSDHPRQAIVARSIRRSAPRIDERYPELRSALGVTSKEILFRDIRRYQEFGLENLNKQITADILDLISATRRNVRKTPRPETVDAAPEAVASILDSTPDAIEDQIVRENLLNSHILLSSSPDLSTPEGAWFQELEWVESGSYTEHGELVHQYTLAGEDQRRDFEAGTLLLKAREDTGLLVGNRLEEAVETLSVPFESPPPEFTDLLCSIADAESRNRAISAAEDVEAVRGEGIDIDDPEDVLQPIKKSRPDKTNQFINGLEQIPLRLYREMPESTYPDGLKPILKALTTDTVANALDSAIAENQSQFLKTVEKLEELIVHLNPLLDNRTISGLNSVIENAKEMKRLMSPDDPTSPQDCVSLYSAQLRREADTDFSFAKTEREVSDKILATCEEYIRSEYRQWANSDRDQRDIELIVDTPSLVKERFSDYNHLVLIISDGFGLRQWLEAVHSVGKIEEWTDTGVASNTLMSTIFPSETGAGHYSFLTGQLPDKHKRDDIQKTIDVDDVALFKQARDVGAYIQVLAYLPAGNGGFSEVMAEHSDGFGHLEGLRAESAALSKNSQQKIAETVTQHDKSLTVLQHNQIDQIHEGSDHIADTLASSVARDVIEYIEGLAANLDDNVGLILTADHGMVRTRDSRKSITYGEGKKVLKSVGESYDGSRLGQRVAGLKAKSSGRGISGQTTTTEYFEVLPKQKMRELRTLTDDKCNGRVLRMRRRYYSETDAMTATHGGFTFDEMFIPFVEFDLDKIVPDK